MNGNPTFFVARGPVPCESPAIPTREGQALALQSPSAVFFAQLDKKAKNHILI